MYGRIYATTQTTSFALCTISFDKLQAIARMMACWKATDLHYMRVVFALHEAFITSHLNAFQSCHRQPFSNTKLMLSNYLRTLAFR